MGRDGAARDTPGMSDGTNSTEASPKRRRSTKRTEPITAEAIVDTAFRLIEERGPEGFSMRAVASALGGFPANLYWHVGDRAQLINLVEQRWIESVELPDDTLDWREWMTELAHRFRANAHRHPNVTRLMSLERASSSGSLALPDAVLGRLSELGLGDDLVHAYNALVGGTLGFVVMELARVGDPGSESALAAESDLRNLDPGRFPHASAHFDDLADRAFSMRWTDASQHPLHESFAYFIDLMLDGLAMRLGNDAG
jgi:TetR/AcrR family transcriptional regulator, tetracycline repressor protein